MEFVGGPMDGRICVLETHAVYAVAFELPVGFVRGVPDDRECTAVMHEYAVDDAPDERGIHLARHTQR